MIRADLKGRGACGQSVQYVYEFGEAADSGGIRLPREIFFTQVGLGNTLGSIPRPLTSITINPELDKDFRENFDVTPGRVDSEKGALKGTLLYASVAENNSAYIVTNWASSDTRAAGLENRDRLVFKAGNFETELDFFISQQDGENSQDWIWKKDRAMTMNPTQGDFFTIQLASLSNEEVSLLKKELTPRRPIEVRKKLPGSKAVIRTQRAESPSRGLRSSR